MAVAVIIWMSGNMRSPERPRRTCERPLGGATSPELQADLSELLSGELVRHLPSFWCSEMILWKQFLHILTAQRPSSSHDFFLTREGGPEQ